MVAACAEGYVGTPAVEACTSDGGSYVLSGCALDPFCLAPTTSAGYKVTETNLRKSLFDVAVECKEGYVGQATATACTKNGENYELTGCELDPVCLAPSDVEGYKVTESHLSVSKFQVDAECAEGFFGTASVTACTSNGEHFSISGCELDPLCMTPTSLKGYKVTEANLLQSVFDVTAECAVGYLGTATVAACSADGEAFTLSGCEKDKLCVAPSDVTGYDVTEVALLESKFDVTVKCAPGYLGTAAVAACSADGEAYTLSGCEKDKLCSAPSDATGYTVTEVALAGSKFDVTAECAVGYLGTAAVAACTADGQAYTLSGCEKDKLCVAPSDVTGYDVTEVALLESKFEVTVTCAPGYLGTAAVAACSADGEAYTLSGCEKDKLCSAPSDATGYTVTEVALAGSKFDVTAECAVGYLGTAAVAACTADGQAYTLSGCEKDKLCVAPSDVTGYDVTEVALLESKFEVTVKCAPGYLGTAAAAACSADGEAYTLSGCEKDKLCSAPSDATGYMVTEVALAGSKFDVTAECAVGYLGTADVAACSADGQAYTLSGCEKDKLCIAPSDVTGYEVTEVALLESKFDVTVKCAPGYLGTAAVAACSADGEAYTLSGCEKDKLCSAPSDATGYTVTEVALAGSKFDVTAECAVGYLGTADVAACSADGQAYTLSGCEKDNLCVAPSDVTGYEVTEVALLESKFDVTVKCATGYVGTAAVAACSADGQAYTLSGCEKDKLCVAPSDVTGYDVTEVALLESKFDVTVKCAAGYLGTAAVAACSADGEAYTLSGCEKDKLCNAPSDATGYMVTEVALAGSKFDVTAECAAGYMGTAAVAACAADGQAYTLSGCDKDRMCIAPSDATGYKVTEVVLSGSKFDVTAECATGYVGTVSVAVCSADGAAYTLSGCEKEKLCVSPSDAKAYVVTETVLAASMFDVTAKCAEGYVGTASASACSSDGKAYTLSGCEKEVYCVAPMDSTGYQVNEISLAKSKFDVKVSCASGFSGTASVAPCSKDGTNYALSGCSKR